MSKQTQDLKHIIADNGIEYQLTSSKLQEPIALLLRERQSPSGTDCKS